MARTSKGISYETAHEMRNNFLSVCIATTNVYEKSVFTECFSTIGSTDGMRPLLVVTIDDFFSFLTACIYFCVYIVDSYLGQLCLYRFAKIGRN